MTSKRPSDSWNRGDPYELYVGRWSHLVANEFLDWLDLPPSLRWLDEGCGTGALTAAIWEECRPAQPIGIDPSEGFLTKARTRLEANATFRVASADIPIGDSEIDVVVSGLVLNFIPNPLMRYFWDAAVELNSAARELDEGVRFPLCRPDAMENAFRDANLAAIRVGSGRWRFPHDFWTSTIIGSRSSVGKAPRPRMQCPLIRHRAIDCKIEFVNACLLNPMDRFRLPPGHGQSSTERPDDATPNPELNRAGRYALPPSIGIGAAGRWAGYVGTSRP